MSEKDGLARVGEWSSLENETTWLTIDQASQLFKCSHMTIRRRIWDKSYESLYTWGKWLVSKQSIDAHLRESTHQRLNRRKNQQSFVRINGVFKLIK